MNRFIKIITIFILAFALIFTLGYKVNAVSIYENHYILEEVGNGIPVIPRKSLTSIDILGEEEYNILVKLLYAEAGGMNEEGQIYTCSAILNLRDYYGWSIWGLAHDEGTMAVAPYVDWIEPTEMQFKIIDLVLLEGKRVPDICFWRTDYYHDFGTPVCYVDGHYFSMP